MFRRNGNKDAIRRDGTGAPGGDDFIIRAEGIVKTYDTGTDRVHALRGVDFAVQRGEMVAVMGPSGCGKTTLLNALSGLDTVDAGTIWLEGQDLAKLSDRKRTEYRARRMGFVFQVYNLLPVLSAVENVELPLLVSGCARRRRGRGRGRRWRRWGWRRGPRTGRRSCPVGSGSG